MRSLLARVGAPRRIIPLFAAAVAVQLPTAALAQLVPVGQTAESEVFTASLTPGRPYVEVVQPRLRLDDAGAFDASLYAPRRIEVRPDGVNPVALDDVPPALLVNPEPSTFALLAGAGAVLGAAARRRARGRA